MADSSPFAIRFRKERGTLRLYEDAIELSARIYLVIELATNERYFLRDQLDRKATAIPQLVAQALSTSDMAERRTLYVRARQLVIDVMAILDMLDGRRSVEPEAIATARGIGKAMLVALAEHSAPPPRVW